VQAVWRMAEEFPQPAPPSSVHPPAVALLLLLLVNIVFEVSKF
jgi:hypothetical protein